MSGGFGNPSFPVLMSEKETFFIFHCTQTWTNVLSDPMYTTAMSSPSVSTCKGHTSADVDRGIEEMVMTVAVSTYRSPSAQRSPVSRLGNLRPLACFYMNS